jgi:hypothetical protein
VGHALHKTGDAIRYLKVTQTGKKWISNLFSNIFTEEHSALWFGPEKGKTDSADAGITSGVEPADLKA